MNEVDYNNNLVIQKTLESRDSFLCSGTLFPVFELQCAEGEGCVGAGAPSRRKENMNGSVVLSGNSHREMEFQETTLRGGACQEHPKKLCRCTPSISISTGACWCFFSVFQFVWLCLCLYLFFGTRTQVLFQAIFLLTYFSL